jgi:hypothetical protein
MSNRLRIALACSALWFGLALAPASASESRVSFFTFGCNGQSQSFFFNATGLNTNPGIGQSRFIQGAEITLFQNPNPTGGGYIAMFVNGDPNRLILTMPVADNHVSEQFTGFFQFTTNPAGMIPIEIQGFCTGGGTLQGIATVWFFS